MLPSQWRLLKEWESSQFGHGSAFDGTRLPNPGRVRSRKVGQVLALLIVTLGAGVGVLSGAVGFLFPPAFVLAGFAALIWLVTAWKRPGLAVGLWVLAATNTLLIVNMDRFRVSGMLRPEDPILALMVVAALMLAASGRRAPPLNRWTVISLWIFAALWGLTTLRSWVMEDVALLKAVLFGRDFLFFAITLVAARALLRTVSDRLAALAVCVLGACIYSVAVTTYALTGIKATWIIHPVQENITSGLVRPYQWSATIVWLLVLPCLMLGLTDGVRWRRVWLAASLLLACGTAFSQTRASYLGLFAGLAVAVVFALRHGSLGRGVSHLYWYAVLIVGGVALLGVMSYPVLEGASTAIGERLGSAFAAVMGSEGADVSTWDYRRMVAAEMLRLLDGAWPWGMGFLHPAVRYFPELPHGTIRNNDLGVLQLLMTMGAAGVVSLLAVVAGVLGPVALRLWRSGSEQVPEARWPFDRAMSTGLLASLLGALAASLTLGTFIEAPSALASGVMVAMLLTGVPERPGYMEVWAPPH